MGRWGSFSLPSKIQGKYSPKGALEVSQKFQCEGNETVSMSVHLPVREIHASGITAALNCPSALLDDAYDT